MENTNINELLNEMNELKAKQKTIIKARFLNVAELNKINKRMFEIREQLKRLKIKETDEIGLYIY